MNWTVVLVSNRGGESSVELGRCDVYPLHRAFHPRDSLDRAAVYRIRRLVSPTDEMIDLTEDQYRVGTRPDSVPAPGRSGW